MKLSILYGLLANIFITLSESRASSKNILNEAFNAVTEPYFDIIKNFAVQTNNSITTLKTLVQNAANPQDLVEEDEEILSDSNIAQDLNESELNIPYDIQSLIDQETELDTEEDTDTYRILQDSGCENHGIRRRPRVRVYWCDGGEVSKATYDSKNGVGCFTWVTRRYVCYCPFEFLGNTCEYANPVECELERISHPETCEGRDTFDYVYSYGGAPPCYKVSDKDTVTMITKASCKTKYPQFDFEGVKHWTYQILQTPNVGPNPFDSLYVVNTANLKLVSVPFNIRQKLAFYNWKALAAPYIITTPFTAPQVAGTSNILVDIPVSDIGSFAFSGRYYYELSVLKNVTENVTEVVSSEYNGGYLDQANFKEPTTVKKSSVALTIALSVVGAVILVAIGIGFYLYQRKKARVTYEFVTDQSMVQHR